MCNTGKCRYECWRGKCTVSSDRIPDDALCMTEDPNVRDGSETKKTTKKRGGRRKESM